MNVTLQLASDDGLCQWRVSSKLQDIKYHVCKALQDDKLDIFIEGRLLTKDDYIKWLKK